MKEVIRMVHDLQAFVSRKIFFFCVAIGLIIALLVPNHSSAYSVKDSGRSDLAGDIHRLVGNEKSGIPETFQTATRVVNVGNSECAKLLLELISKYMKPKEVNARWTWDGETFEFKWSDSRNSSNLMQLNPVAAKISSVSFVARSSDLAVDRAISSEQSFIELAQNSISSQISNDFAQLENSHNVDVTYLKAEGINPNTGEPCCAFLNHETYEYNDCN